MVFYPFAAPHLDKLTSVLLTSLLTELIEQEMVSNHHINSYITPFFFSYFLLFQN